MQVVIDDCLRNPNWTVCRRGRAVKVDFATQDELQFKEAYLLEVRAVSGVGSTNKRTGGGYLHNKGFGYRRHTNF